MKTYSEFLDYVKENITEYLPPEYANSTVQVVRVIKNNDMALEGLTICKEKNGASPTIYLEQYYSRVVQGADEAQVLESIAEDYEEAAEYYAHLVDFDISDWDFVQGKVGYYLVSKELNKERLKGKVSKTIGDMAKVYIIIADFKTSGFNFTLIPQEMLPEWGVSEDELDKAAEDNMSVRFPPVLFSMDAALKEKYAGRPAPNLLRKGRNPGNGVMYVLTNRSRLNGASVILYPGLLQKVRVLFGKDYYIIPSSVDEVIIVPHREDIRGFVLEEILRERNEDEMRGMVLSNTVYEYTEETHCMMPVAVQ